MNLKVGSILDVWASALDQFGQSITPTGVQWTSSDPTIASVNPTSGTSCMITGVANGTVTITATCDLGISATYNITVYTPALTTMAIA